MSEVEPKSDIYLPTPTEIYAWINHTYAEDSGSVLQDNPEKLEDFTKGTIDILSQLSGQPKANYFHSIFFPNQSDQEYVWQQMANHDADAAEWLTLLNERRAADKQQERDKRKQMETLNYALIRASIGRIATHPAVKLVDRQLIAGFNGQLGGEPVDFYIVRNTASDKSSKDESEDLDVDLELRFAEEPETFDAQAYESAADKARAKYGTIYDPREISFLHYHARENTSLATVGRSISCSPRLTHWGYQSRIVIDESGQSKNRFLQIPSSDLTVSYVERPKNDPLPKVIKTRTKRDTLSAEKTQQLIDLVESAEPITATS